MSCSPFDLRDYFLKELPEEGRRQVEAHVRGCAACREELDRLYATQAALFALRDEEIPQRIAFVSDKIFEPSPWRRWWAGFWASTARLGFASAAMLSTALVIFSLTRPAPVGQVRGPAPVLPAAHRAEIVSETEIQQRIDRAVAAAVAQSEARQGARTESLIRDIEARDRRERNQLRLDAAMYLDYMQRRDSAQIRSAYNYNAPRMGDAR
jgi:hypothetical protein